ncbi:NAD(P)H-quinone oxidoreductase subunit 3 [Anatilimnocola aggregata]|uniref:NADH-quinone oxidoreductase subunit n=1 Tax=Anatilimnocola aggregata TaxID=2528021 RepID=A0A517YH17_9BACT|nr:NADH-quinone oxidoreductase subunit A [Anatilimnocola aggregata]QDU29530.1 NAD(P)H-quinone oxidoreductase subunit 3 [Anatilimnocola aggregata]
MSAIASSVNIVAYLALFSGAGIIFLFVNLLVGRFLRPSDPHAEKLEIYECGEPTIGSSFVQFDLRFYVVALLFIIFDVEVAFFFPWAATFGKATNAMREEFIVVNRVDGQLVLTPQATDLYREMGVRQPTVPTEVPASLVNVVTSTDPIDRSSDVIHEGMRQLGLVTVVDIGAFFAILMIGFAYVWKRGDLDWVRAVSQERGKQALARTPQSDPLDDAQYLSA